VARRLQAQLEQKAAQAAENPPPDPVLDGRWALVHRPGLLGPALTSDERAERLARVLLARYGIVTREALERETLPLDWAQLYPALNRMELRGEVRRGYFVAGLSGLQFALPDAVEQLRAAPGDAVYVLSALDPANLYGGDLGDAPRFARVPSTHLALAAGAPVALFEDNGDRITTFGGAPAEVVRQAVAAYLARPNLPRRLTVTRWDGEPVARTAGDALLRDLGFQSTPSGLEKWTTQSAA
jgi:ATP-dependent Lhr-like helicase